MITPVTHTHPGSATGVHLRSTSKKKGGSNFGPNVKKPTSWPKGGPDPLDTPPPLDPLLHHNILTHLILCSVSHPVARKSSTARLITGPYLVKFTSSFGPVTYAMVKLAGEAIRQQNKSKHTEHNNVENVIILERL